jgi:hypothetical protein
MTGTNEGTGRWQMGKLVGEGGRLEEQTPTRTIGPEECPTDELSA